MAEAQTPTLVEGATTGDVDDEIPVAAKSAEDRKAAAALSSLDTREEESAGKDVDQEAVKKAMERLGGSGATNGVVAKKNEQKVVKKAVKVDAADVALVVSLRSDLLSNFMLHVSSVLVLADLKCFCYLCHCNLGAGLFFQVHIFLGTPANITSSGRRTRVDQGQSNRSAQGSRGQRGEGIKGIHHTRSLRTG